MTFEQQRRRLSGVVAIPVTPFDAEGAVDGQTYAKLVDRLMTSGIEVVTPNGNTGEFYALDAAEARQCLEVTVEAVAGGRACSPGSGTTSRRRRGPRRTRGTPARTWS